MELEAKAIRELEEKVIARLGRRGSREGSVDLAVARARGAPLKASELGKLSISDFSKVDAATVAKMPVGELRSFLRRNGYSVGSSRKAVMEAASLALARGRGNPMTASEMSILGLRK
jgi:hypothetical protein